jgi:hypothetical protein
MARNGELSPQIRTSCSNYIIFADARREIFPIIHKALQEENINTINLNLDDLGLLGDISAILNRLENRTDIEEEYIGRIFPRPPRLTRS